MNAKTAVVTGGASGIGAAAANCWASEGAKDAILDIDAEGARAVASRTGAPALECDVSIEQQVQAAMERVAQNFGVISGRALTGCTPRFARPSELRTAISDLPSPAPSL